MINLFISIFATLLLAKDASAQAISMAMRWVNGVTDEWKSVNFSQEMANPIVVAGPLSYMGRQPAGVRIRKVTPTGFQVRVQEWNFQDGVHAKERVSYLAMKRGRTVLSNGAIVLAGRVGVRGGGFQTKIFAQPFNRTPIMIATVVTNKETDAVAIQIQNVTTTGFQIRLREQQANAQSHVVETVHFIAWEPGIGMINGLQYQVGTLGINDKFATLWFPQSLAALPTFFANAQTTVGADPYWIRYRNITRARVEAQLQEEGSFDEETAHTIETVGYLLLRREGPPGVGKDVHFVAMGDSITFGDGDNISTDNFREGILPAGGYPPVLTELYAAQLGLNVLIANEGIGGDPSINGLGDVNFLVNAYPLANYFLLLFGTIDANAFMPTPSGRGLQPGDPGYSGSYKDNLQRMITTLLNAGRIPLLAKIPITLGPCSTCTPYPNPLTAPRNLLIQEYNEVVDELVAALVAAGVIPASYIPPDFYNYFAAHQDEFSDNLHPNGVGYQSMAQLWYDALTPFFH